MAEVVGPVTGAICDKSPFIFIDILDKIPIKSKIGSQKSVTNFCLGVATNVKLSGKQEESVTGLGDKRRN